MHTAKLDKLGKQWRLILVGLTLFAVLWSSGCTRRFFRKRADNEVAAILRDKDVFPEWKIENYNVYPDPRARFADLTNPDRPPMPPDDPAASRLAPNPQHPPRAGVFFEVGTGYLDLLASWDAENRAARGEGKVELPISEAPPGFMKLIGLQVQNPIAQEPKDEPARKPYLLRIDQAVELGVINSREFQDRRENLYLAALPVTQERFAFAPQFFAIENAVRERTGNAYVSPAGTNLWRVNTDTGFTKLFSTGALLALSFANQTVINLGGRVTSETISLSNINLDLVQPFLRGGGRATTLEPLTQAERNLVYEIRNYARFRKEFFQTISGTGLGGPGYYPTLIQLSRLRNAMENVAAFERLLERFKAYEEGGQVGTLEVGQIELDLLRSRSTVLAEQQNLGRAFDNFNLQLGLPIDLSLELDDEPLRPISDQLKRFETVLSQTEVVSKTMEKYEVIEEAPKLRERVRMLLTETPLVKGTKVFQVELPRRLGMFEDLKEKELDQLLDKLRGQRRKLLDLRDALEEKGKKLSVTDQATLQELDQLIPYGDLEYTLRQYLQLPWKNLPNEKDRRNLHSTRFREVRKAFDLIISDAVKERLAMIKPNWPTPPPLVVEGQNLLDLLSGEEDTPQKAQKLEQAYEIATQVALANRLDLMNVRAQVTDAWRLVAVSANSLLGVFEVGYHMDSHSPVSQAKPLAFSINRTRHQLLLNAELPLVRLTERNIYRAALIDFQRARRALMAAEDQVTAQVRADLRQLQFLARDFKIKQRNMEVTYIQLDSALERFVAPPIPGQAASDVVALTTTLSNAQTRVPQAQDQLYNTWINYLVSRQQLYLDLELMPLDSRGVWIDEYSPRPLQPAGDGPANGNADSAGRPRLLPPAEIAATPVP
ncbi:MAG: TolC family protein [Gemmataceae bacterium]|nr:TolC family protein [Gemmataceae bacterium]MCI0741023.1 TolC family protein [Gemmataceae bacterium]